MIKDANPRQKSVAKKQKSKQTFEYRVPDGSADVYLTLAALIVASLNGPKTSSALEIAEKLYVDVNIFKPEHKAKRETLEQLPVSCWESADALEKKRKIFENYGIFPAGLIDNQIQKLKKFDDKGLSEKLYGKNDQIKQLVEEFLHIG
jgi:glutamine synthetase